MTDLTTKAAEIRAGLVAELREAALERQRVAWSRADGGQEWTLSAMLADKAADAIENLVDERDQLLALIEQQAAELAAKEWRLKSMEATIGATVAKLTTAESERDELLREKERLTKEARAGDFIIKDLTGTIDRLTAERNNSDAINYTAERRAREAMAGLSTAEATIASQSERIAVLEAERDAAWGRGMRDAAQIAEQRFEDDPGYCVYADGSEIASEIREAIRARSALAPLGEE